MKELTTTRILARNIVDDFTFEIGHTITEPQIDFTKVTSQEISKLIDHIEQIITKAAGGCVNIERK